MHSDPSSCQTPTASSDRSLSVFLPAMPSLPPPEPQKWTARQSTVDHNFQAAYNRGRQELQDALDARLRSLGETAARALKAALAEGDARAALAVLKGLGFLTGKRGYVGSGDPKVLRQNAAQAEKRRESLQWSTDSRGWSMTVRPRPLRRIRSGRFEVQRSRSAQFAQRAPLKWCVSDQVSRCAVRLPPTAKHSAKQQPSPFSARHPRFAVGGDTQMSSDRCADCDYTFPESEPRVPCPECGSTARKLVRVASEVVTLREGLGVKQRREGQTGGRVFESKTQHKTSGETKRPAKEVQAVDRTDPEKTVKYHRVEEQAEDGSWETVHEHTNEYPAKRRPPQRRGK